MNEINMTQLLNQMREMASNIQNAPAIEENKPASTDFSSALQTAIDKVNNTQMNAKQLTEAFEMGNPNVDLPQVMIAMQKASVSFQAMLQVRNKLVDAYHEVMNMPV